MFVRHLARALARSLWWPGALAGLLLVFTGCATDPVTGEKYFAVMQWSLAQEQQMGDEFAPNFASQYDGPYLDPDANHYLGALVREMATHSIRSDDFEYQFQILNSSVPNAFALPGGYVYITRGLLRNLETEGQFISIMGHELGHVEHKHAERGQNRTILAQIGLTILGVGESIINEDPEDPLIVTSLAQQIITPLALLKYSREQELEADRRGVYFAHEMGYDPMEGKKTFEYFEELERQSGASTPELFRTHPVNDERVEQIEETVREQYPGDLRRNPDSFRPEEDNDQFQSIIARLKHFQPAYEQYDAAMQMLADDSDLDRANDLVQSALKQIPDEPLFWIAEGEIRYARETGDRGRKSFEKALGLYRSPAPEQVHWKPNFYLGAIAVDQGDGARATPFLKRASGSYPWHPLPYYYLGRAEEDNGRPAEAVSAYRRVLEFTAPDSSLHQQASARIQALGG